MFAVRPAMFARAMRVLLLAAMASSGSLACAQAPVAAREGAIKAAFLFKFAAFVDWPAGTLARPDDPVVIGVAGSDSIAADLQQIAAARPGDARPITVRRLPDANGWAGIHVLFIGAGREARVRDVAAQARGPVLVVTEQDDGLRLGGALNFVVDEGRVRFTASPAAAQDRGLRLSSRLLALARSVEGRNR